MIVNPSAVNKNPRRPSGPPSRTGGKGPPSRGNIGSRGSSSKVKTLKFCSYPLETFLVKPLGKIYKAMPRPKGAGEFALGQLAECEIHLFNELEII